MSARALEFVETWVSDKIAALERDPNPGKPAAKAWAAQCSDAARTVGIPQAEIDDAFDDLTAYMAGQIEESAERDGVRTDDEHPAILVDRDDVRLVEEAEDEADAAEKDE